MGGDTLNVLAVIDIAAGTGRNITEDIDKFSGFTKIDISDFNVVQLACQFSHFTVIGNDESSNIIKIIVMS